MTELNPPNTLPSPEVGGWDWNFQPSGHTVGSTGKEPQPWVNYKAHLINITEDICVALDTKAIPRVFRSSVPETKDEDQTHVSYDKSQYHRGYNLSHLNLFDGSCYFSTRIQKTIKWWDFLVFSNVCTWEGTFLGGSIRMLGSHSPGGRTVTWSRNSSIPDTKSLRSLAL